MQKKILYYFIFVLISFSTLLTNCEKEGNPEPEPEPNDTTDIQSGNIYDETGCLYTSYEGLVMAGYQGWFAAEGDDSDRGWYHYEKHGRFEPGVSTIDFWPDVREYAVTYETAFQFENGEKAHVYSPVKPTRQ